MHVIARDCNRQLFLCYNIQWCVCIFLDFITVRKDGNVFNRFATALLQGCEDLDANEVWLIHMYMYVLVKP